MEDKIFDIVTDLLREDISKEEAIDKLLILHSDSKNELKEKLQIEFDKGYYKGTQSRGSSF